jgi:RNA polymerase sigma-70 factor (ECF subfamily)
MYSDTVAKRLYAQFCQGDPRASIELTNLLSDRLFWYIRRSGYCNSVELAKDCVQDTWLKLVEYCGKPLEKGTLWGFMCVIAQNSAIDTYRVKNRQKRKDGEERLDDDSGKLMENILADEKADPAVWLEDEDVKHHFKRAIAQLPDRQRLALTLQLEGYSLKVIALRMEEGEETVKSHLRYAKDKLKYLLKGIQTQGTNKMEACL